MAEEIWIKCRVKDKKCILARDEKAYYIIQVGKGLDCATEEWLEEQGISEELLKELQLPFDYIPKSAFRGVAIGGCTVRQTIYLYLKSDKRKLTLSSDYDPEWMEEFFRDIPRFTPPAELPTKHEQKQDWRAGKQNALLLEKLRILPPMLLTIGSVVSVGFVWSGHWAWFTAVLTVLAAIFGLAVGMPVYFTLHQPEKKKCTRALELDLPLLSMFLILMFRFRLNWLSFDALWIVCAIGAAAGVLIYWLCKDLHRVKWGPAIVLLYGAVAGYYLLGHANAVYDFNVDNSCVVQVEELSSSRSRKGGTTWYCTMMLPDGREVKLEIPGSLYRDLEEGDFIRVEYGEGVLGIEYAQAYRYEEGD